MPTLAFDRKLQQVVTSMVEATFAYVNNNSEEVDTLYIYASSEELDCFYNVFFKINGQLIEMHKVNEVSEQQYDVSDDSMFGLLDEGCDLIDEVIRIFQEDEREVPTLMKITYEPKTGAFVNDIIYEPQYSNHPTRTNTNGFKGWFEEIKNEHPV